jgi:hypothetical protein
VTAEPFEPYKSHYFLVGCVMDEEGKLNFFLDDEEAEARFPKGTVWNNGFGEWLKLDSSKKTTETDELMWHELDRRIHRKQ